MKKVIMFFCSLLVFSFIKAQTIEDVQVQPVYSIVRGTSPATPAAYTWGEIANNLQGVNIHLFQSEVKEIYAQQNNYRLAFNLLKTSSFILKLEVRLDGGSWVTLYDDTSVQSVGWYVPPSGQGYNDLGEHTLDVRYYTQSSTSPFLRTYNLRVTPAADKFFRDNTKSTDPNVFTSGNTLTLWENPTLPNAKPIILSEGFDPANDKYAEFNRYRGDYLAEELFKFGYQVYILNYNLGNQNLRNNAAVMHSAIHYISDSLHNGAEVAVAGASMGGIIA